MDREIEWSKGRPEEPDFASNAAATANYFGKSKEAEALERRSLELYKAQGRKENSAQSSLALAGNQVYLGKCSEALENAKAALATFRGQVTMANAALIFAACEDLSQAQSLRTELLKQYPKNTFLASVMAPMVEARLEASRGNVDRAIQILESLRGYDMGGMTGVVNIYTRGNFHLRQGRGNEAAAEFKTIVDRPHVDPFSPAHALARLGLGRALALTGDTAGARKAYQDFFALWKDADPDLPALIQARKEYDQLK